MSAYRRRFTTQFKKDLKTSVKRGKDVAHLDRVIERLANGEALEARYRMHALSGGYKHCWECHVEPDWLLIWFHAVPEAADEADEIVFVRLGTHADLFG